MKGKKKEIRWNEEGRRRKSNTISIFVSFSPPTFTTFYTLFPAINEAGKGQGKSDDENERPGGKETSKCVK